MAVTVRLLTDNELPLANDFFNRIYKTNRSLKNFEWEFVNGPAGKAIYVGAVDATTGSVVGIQCAIPLEFIKSDGTIVLTAKSEDTLVDPAYRGQKLFERMYELLFSECKNAGIKYIWGFTPALKAFERIGFSAPFRTSQALLSVNPLRAYKHLSNLNTSNKFKDKFKIFGLSWLSFIKQAGRTGGDGKILLKESAHYDKDEILKSFYGDGHFFFVRQNTSYNQWRLELNPFGNEYHTLLFEKNGNTVADAIVNVRSGVSYIEQVLFSKHLSDTECTSVIRQLIQFLRSKQTPLIRALCFAHNEDGKRMIRLLKKAGFTYLDRGNYFVWKSLDVNEAVSVPSLFLSRLFTQGNL